MAVAWALPSRIGFRGAALLFFALVGGVYCYALATAPRPLAASYVWADSVLPLWVWAGLWGATGAVCAVCAFVQRDSAGFVGIAFMSAWWGLLSAAGWLFGSVDRGFLNAALFIPMTGFVYIIAAGLRPKVPKERS